MFKIIHITTLTPVKAFLKRELKSYLTFDSEEEALLEIEEETFFMNGIDGQIVSSHGYHNGTVPHWLIDTLISKREFTVVEDV